MLMWLFKLTFFKYSSSIFKNKIPFSLSPLAISNFASKIFSFEPKLPICAVPILVIIAISGFA